MKKLGAWLLLLSFTAILLKGAADLVPFGDPEAPLHQKKSLIGSQGASQYYINNAYEDTHTPNFVTVVLADYRSFDTMGETLVVFIAGLGAFLILGYRGKGEAK